MKRGIIVLGATGTVGVKALDILGKFHRQYKVQAISAHSRWKELVHLAKKYKVPCLLLTDEKSYHQAREQVSSLFKVLYGIEGFHKLLEDQKLKAVFVSIASAMALTFCLAALKGKKDLLIANKESLVMAGPLLQRLARQNGSQLIPVDSEHSALFQLLEGKNIQEVQSLILTASGGPFYQWPASALRSVTKEQAVKHPIWNMGPKISIDSATLMNKALEIIEARWLFNFPSHKIDVVIHPESIIHSMVRCIDGSVFAHLSYPDMRLPIQYALTYPNRAMDGLSPLDLTQVGTLRFFKPDTQRFPLLSLGYKAAEEGGVAGAVLNAANEVAVDLFLKDRVSFLGIGDLVARAYQAHTPVKEAGLKTILESDQWARQEVLRLS